MIYGTMMFGELGDILHNSSNASSQQAMEIVFSILCK